jgi:glycosyltransferase involved in cell wall biosynthesis
LLKPCLAPVVRLIAEELARRNLKPDLVHAHKLTVDGIVANDIRRAFACPMICNVWGNTDQQIIRAKPLSRRIFRAVADGAQAILPASPWAGEFVAATLNIHHRKIRILPVVCHLQPATPSMIAPNRVATMFNLDGYTGKNIATLINAVALLRQRGRPVELDIYGGGSPASIAAIAGRIARVGMEPYVTLRGPVAHAKVQETINRYAAFAMPSRRETFGMVFIEALFAGVPILYPRGQSLDGFFDGVEVGQKCEARSVEDVARKLDRILGDEAALKHNIAALHAQGFFRQFEPAAIASAYADIVQMAISGTVGQTQPRTHNFVGLQAAP